MASILSQPQCVIWHHVTPQGNNELKVIDVMVNPSCPKTPADSMLGTHNGTCGYALGTSVANKQLMPFLCVIIVRRAGLLWSQQDFEWRWSVPLFKCLTVLEFSFILFDLCLLITFFNFIMNYVPIVTFWIFTYHKIWILSIMFCFIWSYWIIYFLACLEVSWRVVS